MVKLNKKGFTLIELLAVIVVLAIILAIAIPSVMNTINESKKGSLVSSAQMAISAAEKYELDITDAELPALLTFEYLKLETTNTLSGYVYIEKITDGREYSIYAFDATNNYMVMFTKKAALNKDRVQSIPSGLNGYKTDEAITSTYDCGKYSTVDKAMYIVDDCKDKSFVIYNGNMASITPKTLFN